MSVDEIRVMIEDEIKREKQLQSFMVEQMEKLPPGSLQIKHLKNDDYYYQVISENKKYMNNCLDPTLDLHRQVIKELIPKKAMTHGLPILRGNIDAMEKCAPRLRNYSPLDYRFGDLLGKEYYLDGDVCLREWMKIPENQNPAFPKLRIHDTKRGVLVRSKSEVMIADSLFDRGILYKNETKLTLEGENYYPDFEIFHPKIRKIIWWEHLGRIADPKYVYKNLKKITVYGRNGIIVGENLILTWETEELPLTHRMIDQRIREFDLV